MNIKLGDTHTIRWVTADPATGAKTDASAQTVSIFEESTDTAIVTPTATKRATGSYRADIVATSGNGFEAGKIYNIEVEATVGGVAISIPVLTFKVDAKSMDDLASTGAQMDLVNAPNATAVTAIQNGVKISVGTGAGQINLSSGKVPATVAAGDDADGASIKTTIGIAGVGLTNLGDTRIVNLDAKISDVKGKTDNIPASPAAVGSAMTLANGAITAAVIATDAIDADAISSDAITEIQAGLSKPGTAQTISSNSDITDIKAKTDNLPASPAAVSNIPTAAANASAVRTELSTELGRIDAAVSTRSAPGIAQTITAPSDMALNSTVAKDATVAKDLTVAKDATVMKAAGYTAPDNASVTAIKAKTDNLPSDPADQSMIIAATDQVRSDIAAIPSAPSASANASAVRTELSSELAKVSAIDLRLPTDPADQSSVEAAIAAIPAAPTASAIATEILDNQTA